MRLFKVIFIHCEIAVFLVIQKKKSFYQIEKKRHGLVLMGTISIESSSGHNGPSGLIQNHHVNPSAFLRFNIFKYCCSIDGDWSFSLAGNDFNGEKLGRIFLQFQLIGTVMLVQRNRSNFKLRSRPVKSSLEVFHENYIRYYSAVLKTTSIHCR